LLKKLTTTVTSSARARWTSVHASAIPRVVAAPLARLAHVVVRIRSKRDSAKFAAMVRDWVLVRLVKITDAVPARASTPTLKITTAINNSTIVTPRSERGDGDADSRGVVMDSSVW